MEQTQQQYLLTSVTCGLCVGFFFNVFSFFITGLPKAAVITNLQVLNAAGGLWAFGATKNDILYITLPLYHSSAALVGICGCIELGRPHYNAL